MMLYVQMISLQIDDTIAHKIKVKGYVGVISQALLLLPLIQGKRIPYLERIYHIKNSMKIKQKILLYY
jgi:hypothetical protein